jgi:ADP-ribosyl-[dinitrogen reductase] hydrolase
MPGPKLEMKSRFLCCLVGCARITQQDPRSVAGGIAIAKAAQLLATPDEVDEVSFCGAIADAIRPYEATFADLIEGLPTRLGEDRETAVPAIAWAGSLKPEFSRPIITPFAVPTVLAALWAVLQHQSSWPDAVCAAIHLGGDVDTLGAIVGALAGVRFGDSAIPANLASGVLGADRITALASNYYDVVSLRSVGRE